MSERKPCRAWTGPKRMSSFWSLFWHNEYGNAVGDLTIWDDGKVTFTGDAVQAGSIPVALFAELVAAAGVAPLAAKERLCDECGHPEGWHTGSFTACNHPEYGCLCGGFNPSPTPPGGASHNMETDR